MRPIQTPECTHRFTLPGAGDDRALPAERVRVFDVDLGETEDDARTAHVTRWMVSAEEAARLFAGAAIELTVWGENHPPVSLSVGKAIAEEIELIRRDHIDRAVGALYAVMKDQGWLDTNGDESPDAIGPMGPGEFVKLWHAAVEGTKR